MIQDILTKEVIRTNVECKTWRECVCAAGDLLIQAGKVTEEFNEKMIEVVEEYGPYMILVPKVGFFHAKPGSYIKEPCLSLITLKDEVSFDDFNGEIIKCAFAFGAVDHNSHLELLANLASLLEDRKFIELILNESSVDEILEFIHEERKENL